MKVIPFLLLSSFILLWVLGRPDWLREREQHKNFKQHHQQARNSWRFRDIQVSFQVENPKDEEVADIIWLKKAAIEVQRRGFSYFNTISKTITRRFIFKHNQSLTYIDGIIRPQTDSMTADYDAKQISSLTLSEEIKD
jgi:hypothetical protein